ncbi:MAG: hypothetical protein IBJ14_04655 [Hydrogenophaga sp.]|nr:hypothetical protein [Hydrogenophaga sp.]
MPQPGSESRGVRLALAIGGLLLFFIPLLSVVLYVLLVSSFTQTAVLKPAADMASIAGALFWLALAWNSLVGDVRTGWIEGKWKLLLQSIGLFLFTPIFGWAVLQAFFAGPVSYVLHSVAGSESSTREVVVLRADDFGGRGCRNRIVLQNGALFWREELCGVSSDAVNQLRRGGRLRIQGTFSQYGIQLERYQVIDGA